MAGIYGLLDQHDQLKSKVEEVMSLYHKTMAMEHDDSNFEDGYRCAMKNVYSILSGE